jgi:hypothetical protein
MKSLAALLIFCVATSVGAAPTSATPTITVVHTAAGSYGVQKAGEDAGPLYAFVKIDSDKADTLKLTSLFVTHDKKVCAKTTKPLVVTRIKEIKDANAQLRVDADKGTPWKGELVKGTTWLRIEAVMDHQCPAAKPEPVVRLTFASGNIPIEATRPFDQRLPS